MGDRYELRCHRFDVLLVRAKGEQVPSVDLNELCSVVINQRLDALQPSHHTLACDLLVLLDLIEIEPLFLNSLVDPAVSLLSPRIDVVKHFHYLLLEYTFEFLFLLDKVKWEVLGVQLVIVPVHYSAESLHNLLALHVHLERLRTF